MPEQDAVPGTVIGMQSFGDFLAFNPHCHVLVTDGCFYGNGMFRVTPSSDTKDLEKIFQHKLLKMPLSEGKPTQDLINMMLSWRHSGFNVFCGQRILPREENAMENPARSIIRASFSIDTQGKIPYTSTSKWELLFFVFRPTKREFYVYSSDRKKTGIFWKPSRLAA